MILGRHHVVVPKHGQMTLHGFDVGFRKPVGDHADAILRTHSGGGALSVEQGVGPQGPLVVRPRLDDVKARRAFQCKRQAIQLVQLPLHDSAKHCLNLGP